MKQNYKLYFLGKFLFDLVHTLYDWCIYYEHDGEI